MSKDLQTRNRQNKLALWARRITECRSSGQNVKTWCKNVAPPKSVKPRMRIVL